MCKVLFGPFCFLFVLVSPLRVIKGSLKLFVRGGLCLSCALEMSLGWVQKKSVDVSYLHSEVLRLPENHQIGNAYAARRRLLICLGDLHL